MSYDGRLQLRIPLVPLQACSKEGSGLLRCGVGTWCLVPRTLRSLCLESLPSLDDSGDTFPTHK